MIDKRFLLAELFFKKSLIGAAFENYIIDFIKNNLSYKVQINHVD